MVDKFVRRYRSAGLVSIIEPVVRPPRHPVGTLIVKAPLLPPPQSLVEQRLIFTKPRMPLGGKGDEKTLLAACQQLNDPDEDAVGNFFLLALMPIFLAVQ